MAKKKKTEEEIARESLEADIIAYVYGHDDLYTGMRFSRQPILRVTSKQHHRILMRHSDSDAIIWMATIKFNHQHDAILVGKFGDLATYDKDLAILRLYYPW